MLVVISDIHFQDIGIQDTGLQVKVRSDQNVNHKAFIDFFQWVAEEYCDKSKSGSELKIALNGDIIDLLRTENWFHGDPVRPYEDYHDKGGITWEDPKSFPEPSPNILQKTIEIFDAITGRKLSKEECEKSVNVEGIKKPFRVQAV